MARARSSFPFLVAGLLAAAVGCSFDPDIADGRLICSADDQCPRGFGCQEVVESVSDRRLRACCREVGCRGLSQTEKNQIFNAHDDAGVNLDVARSDGPGASSDGCLCGEAPLPPCPTTCPTQPGTCKLGRIDQPGTCRARCVHDEALTETACVAGDGCCPSTCNAATDGDCNAMCGNGVVESPGEQCDPQDSCPTECPALGCTLRKLEGSKDICTARCVEIGPQTVCMSGDKCCPPTCTTANDDDCRCMCGDGRKEEACGETCDPKGDCPTTCPPQGCMLQKLLNADTCQAVCVPDKLQTACTNGDKCCPPGCNANNDNDCTATCGNGVKEADELCDPMSTCPMSCAWMACARRRLDGDAKQCKAQCLADGMQTACAHGDGCCPPSCNSVNDNDCNARCGNGVREGNEKCDGPDCPTSCPAMGCQRRKLQGSASQCSAECVNDTLIAACTGGDGCCASGCTSVNDSDCDCRCGNGVTEPACDEKCDGGNCPTACPAMACQKRKLQGSATLCTAQCVNDVVETMCKPGDGCCPPGCNANNDNDCTPVCGNGTVESGEKCDPASACQAQSDACTDNANNVRMRTGMVSNCTFQCVSTPRPCKPLTDGFCPTAPIACMPCGATCGSNQDIDCKLTNGAACTDCNQCPTACTDGRCCAGTCSACQSCTGSGGTCVNIGPGLEDNVPAGACSGSNSCNGAGACRLDNGQACNDGTQCASGACVEGVCCENSCTTACRSCALSGMLGLCRPIASGPDNVGGTCSGSNICISGACKKVDGELCAVPADCATNVCSTFFIDNDGDGYGVVGVSRCGSNAPPGHAKLDRDCCDSDNRAFPGQPFYFGSQRGCGGGYDYDCSNFTSKQPANTATYGCMPCRSGFDPDEYATANCGNTLDTHGCMPSGVGGICFHPMTGTGSVGCH